jgi:hypothetical protein
MRPFRGVRLLGATVPARGVALELVQVLPGEHVARRASSRTLMMVLDGGGELVSEARHPVQTGDSITIPESSPYEITAGPKGFEALAVAFSNQQGEMVRQVLTLEQLLARNQARTEASLQKPMFRKLMGDGLRDSAERHRFYECLRVFSEALQTLLIARQATCSDADYAALFLDQLRRELTREALSTGGNATPMAFDPVLAATASWFCQQMFLLDDLDKTVINLVLETAGGHLQRLVQLVCADDVRATSMANHALAGDPQKLALHRLENQPPQVYRRLSAVLDRSWDMFEAMTGQIIALIERKAQGGPNGS